MKIAFLSDIHANLQALEAALRITDALRADRLVVAGDIVGDGPHPAETVTLLRERAAYAIRGNVDREVLGLGDDEAALRQTLGNGATPRAKNRAWTALHIAGRQRRWLARMAGRSVFHVGRTTVMVVHGSPRGDTDYIYPSITEEALRTKLDGQDPRPDVLIAGHSHLPFVRTVDGVLVVNCGSVGRPVDGDPRGSFAVVDFLHGTDPVATVIRFEYDVDGVMAAAQEREVPGIDAAEYRSGVKA
jgi:putative phosphoesterase